MLTNILIYIFCSKTDNRLFCPLLIETGTYRLAEVAINANIKIYRRIEKAFLILTHCNALLGTLLHTSVTATAVMFVYYTDHLRNVFSIGFVIKLRSYWFMERFQHNGIYIAVKTAIPITSLGQVSITYKV